MPCATQGTVKAVAHEELEAMGFSLIMANTYYLVVRPGLEVIRCQGGLHRFMSWPKLIATDSGGFQVMSLARFRTVTDRGVVFRAPVDGQEHEFTPESVMACQETFGSDLAMCLDECPPAGCSREAAERAVRLTTEWARRALAARRQGVGSLFGIVQGAFDQDLRRRSVEEITALDFDGFAVGGLSVGETKPVTLETLAFTVPLLPFGKPRYLMGVGEPGDVLEAIGVGVDLFDCVFPTRVARNGLALTSLGRVSIRNAPVAGKDGPLDEACNCPACRRYSQAYLRHLIRAKEITGFRLLSLHNLTFMRGLMEEARVAILAGSFEAFQRERLAVWRSAPAAGC